MLTWMSLESGWEARTPVQVRSERLSAATALMDLGGAAAAAAAAPLEEEEEEGATGALAPLLAAAAAFFCAAFFLLASETMMTLALLELGFGRGRWRALFGWVRGENFLLNKTMCLVAIWKKLGSTYEAIGGTLEQNHMFGYVKFCQTYVWFCQTYEKFFKKFFPLQTKQGLTLGLHIYEHFCSS